MTTGWRPYAPARVLVVDDNWSMRRDIANAMLAEGYEVCTPDEGTPLDDVVGRFAPDLALIDVELSGGTSGRALAQRLLETGTVQVIFVTSAATIGDRLAGFALGVDDYITKPFAMAELAARVRAVLRRSGRVDPSVLEAGLVRLDLNRHIASVAGAQLSLTKTEFALLEAFCQAPDKVLSKTHLMNRIWIYDGMNPNVVEVHLSALRRKMAAHAPRLIQTVHGIGYLLRTDIAAHREGQAC
jgi:DNA-binding response OmpR family regulator